jgi:hypothetical protein
MYKTDDTICMIASTTSQFLIMRKRWLLVASTTLVLAGVSCYFAYQKYYVSRVVGNGFCSSLTASGNASMADISYYLREAHLASRTKKDASLIALWEEFVAATSAASEAHQDIENGWKEDLTETVSDPLPCFHLEGDAEQTCVDRLSAKLLAQTNLHIASAENEKISVLEMQASLPVIMKQYQAVCANPEGLQSLHQLSEQLNSRIENIETEIRGDRAYAEKISESKKLQDTAAEERKASVKAQEVAAKAARDKRKACIDPLLAQLSQVENEASPLSRKKAELIIGCPTDSAFSCLTPDQRTQVQALVNQQVLLNRRETELQVEIRRCSGP